MRGDAEAERAVGQYADMVHRICFLYLKNGADEEDVFQDVFLKYILYSGTFSDEQHEKAWFARVAINRCKDILKSAFRRRTAPLAENMPAEGGWNEAEWDLMNAVCALPENYKAAIYLHYYEGYSAVEIARLLHKKENTIYTWISRGKGILKNILGDEADEPQLEKRV